MHIKLLKHVLVADTDVIPTPRGTVVEVSDAQGKDFIAAELAIEVKAVEAKAAAPHENKMADAPENKSAKKAK